MTACGCRGDITGDDGAAGLVTVLSAVVVGGSIIGALLMLGMAIVHS